MTDDYQRGWKSDKGSDWTSIYKRQTIRSGARVISWVFDRTERFIWHWWSDYDTFIHIHWHLHHIFWFYEQQRTMTNEERMYGSSTYWHKCNKSCIWIHQKLVPICELIQAVSRPFAHDIADLVPADPSCWPLRPPRAQNLPLRPRSPPSKHQTIMIRPMQQQCAFFLCNRICQSTPLRV